MTKADPRRVGPARRLLGLLTVAAWLFASLARAAEAPPPMFTPAERAAVLPALRDCGTGATAPSGPLDDAALKRALLARANLELGQRVRPTDVDPTWAIEPPVRDVAVELAKAQAEGRLVAWISDLAPKDPRYTALTAACRTYAALAAGGGWATLADGSPLRLGDRDPQVPALRQRLAREGFVAKAGSEADVFDGPLEQALTAFQLDHGLEADGVAGPKTRAALNVPAEARLQQIQMNLERWRWMPRPLPDERLEVDIAGAQAALYGAGRPVLTMKVVVGDAAHRTPMFASQVESIVFNPPWNVPASIASKEILPKARRDPAYLAKNGFTYVDGRLVQKPGPKNALGVMKFDLPSPFGVYLHDTPSKSAFSRVDRALSHGCMRLEKPRELGALLLQRQGGSSETVDVAIAQGVTSRVALKTPVPLYVAYWTAVADADGRVRFRPDVYGWDQDLAAALAAAPAGRAALSRIDTDCVSAAQ